MLAALVQKFDHNTDMWGSQSIGSALYGLQGFADSQEVRSIFAALAPRIAASTEAFTPQTIFMAFRGLQGKDGACVETRAVLDAMSSKIRECPGPVVPRTLQFVFGVLSDLGEPSPEVRTLVGVLVGKVSEVADQLNDSSSDAIREALRAMPGAESDAVLRALGTEASREAGTLPPGWVQHEHEGRVYYYHAEHGSQWENPQPPSSLPQGWTSHVAPDGRQYFHHAELGSQWTVPTATA